MCPKDISLTPLSSVLGYSQPKFHEGKTSFVDFFCYDPVLGKMRRKKYHLDSAKKRSERRKLAATIISGLSEKLRSGWNPWSAPSESRLYTDIDEALDRYAEYIRRSCRQRTFYSYSSRIKVFKEFLQYRPIPVRYTYQFDTALVNDFLDWILLDRGANPRTRNNYRGWCSALGDWMLMRKYITENPASAIRNLKETGKFRTDIAEKDLKLIFRYLKKQNPRFLLACYFEYFTFIRPSELSFLKISDISVKEQKVLVTAEHSKNGRTAYVGLNETLIHLMLDLGTFDFPGDFYLFGRNFLPSRRRMGSDQFNKEWVKMRKALALPPTYQFYSLKDSGIRDLANAEGIVVARDQARHTDISTTNKYLGEKFMKVAEETKHFKGCAEDIQ